MRELVGYCKREHDYSIYGKIDKRGNFYCTKCQRISQKEWLEKNEGKTKEIKRKSHFKTKYGISVKDYEQMEKDHKGCCAICGIHKNGFDKDLYIDHCHDSNKVRGLLCQSCNSGLGFFKDNIRLMLKAIEYLEYSREDERQKKWIVCNIGEEEKLIEAEVCTDVQGVSG